MAPRRLKLTLHPERLAVCRLDADAPLPEWAGGPGFRSATRTADELSLIAPEVAVPENVRREPGWLALQVAGPLEFALTGILASLASPLAAAGVPIFAVSTFETDYLLIQEKHRNAALAALKAAGHTVTGSDQVKY